MCRRSNKLKLDTARHKQVAEPLVLPIEQSLYFEKGVLYQLVKSGKSVRKLINSCGVHNRDITRMRDVFSEVSKDMSVLLSRNGYLNPAVCGTVSQ